MSAENKPEDEMLGGLDKDDIQNESSSDIGISPVDTAETHPAEASADAPDTGDSDMAAGDGAGGAIADADEASSETSVADKGNSDENPPVDDGVDTAEFLNEPGFADSVLAGLEQAGFVEARPRPATAAASDAIFRDSAHVGPKFELPQDDFRDLPTPADDDPTDVFPGNLAPTLAEYFNERAEPSGAALRDPDPVATDAPYEPLASSASDNSLSGEADDADLDAPYAAQKHDALADAVQSALFAVYGGGTYDEEDDNARIGASGSAYTGTTSDRVEPEQEQRPEDVILNFFQYTSKASVETEDYTSQPAAQSEPAVDAGATYRNGAIRAGQFRQAGFSATPPFIDSTSAQASRVDPVARPYSEFERPAPPAVVNLPVPASPDAEIRNNGKLLGAAGLGLIGGIAFAAVLAVFLINSLEPEDVQQAATTRTATPAQPVAAVMPKPEPAKPELTVADLSASPGQPVPLNIGLKSAPPNEQTLVSITGVPPGGRLNSGVDAGGGNWLLPPRRLNGLTLLLPATVEAPVEIGVQLLDSNVRMPLSDKRVFNIAIAKPQTPSPFEATVTPTQIAAASLGTPATPPSEPPAQQVAALPGAAPSFSTQTVPSSTVRSTPPEAPAPQARTPEVAPLNVAIPRPGAREPMPGGDIQDLIREGNRHMREGDILKAREFYEQAVQTGNAEAALAMGRSFDPSYFDRLERRTGEPDPAKAFEWYREAMNAGLDRAAQVRIENLRRYLNR